LVRFNEVLRMAAAFALTPTVAVVRVINFNTSVGRKLYESATAKIAEELYDCKPDGLYQFLQLLSNRARAFGWDDKVGGILQIPENLNDLNSDTDNLKFITSKGTMNRVMEKAAVHFKITGKDKDH
jgi:hypothetical protein